MAGLGAWGIGDDGIPGRLEADRSLLEAKLEAWIEQDPSILDGEVRWVSRQLVLPDRSRLDLLGLTPDSTWVIAELKASAPTADAVRQAVHYFMEMDSMSNADLVARIRQRGLSNPAVDAQLEEMLLVDDEDRARDYRILIAGIGDGDGAESAAATLARYGFSIPIDIVGFQLFATSDGHVLIREVEEDAATGLAQSSRWSLDAILERAGRFGIGDGFERIRTELLSRGYRSHLKKHGLNFNLGSRRQVFWIQPQRDGIRVGYCSWNFPDLFGISREDAELRLGPNWLTLDSDAALTQIRTWCAEIDELAQPTDPQSGSSQSDSS